MEGGEEEEGEEAEEEEEVGGAAAGEADSPAGVAGVVVVEGAAEGAAEGEEVFEIAKKKERTDNLVSLFSFFCIVSPSFGVSFSLLGACSRIDDKKSLSSSLQKRNKKQK